MARLHFRRTRLNAERGFRYDAEADHYHCPQGERLALHYVESANRLAVYRAPASSCNACPLKAACTPHEEGRHIYRPLAAWAETNVGRFHRRLALLMIAVGAIFSAGGFAVWGGRQGTGLLLLTLLICFAFLARHMRAEQADPADYK